MDEKLVYYIEGMSNPTVKSVRKLKNKKERQEQGKYLMEGINLCKEVFDAKPDIVEQVFVTRAFFDESKELLPENKEIFVVLEHIFESLCDTKSPQGILVVAKIENGQLKEDGGFYIYLDHVADPGNVGTIIRTADAAGVDGVIVSPECADLFCSKTVRATMGSMFHLNIVIEENYLEGLSRLKNQGFKIVTGSLDGLKTPFEANLGEKVVICVGNEAHGVSKELVSLGVEKVKIPILGRAESLNVSVASAVLMYEAVRQREMWK